MQNLVLLVQSEADVKNLSAAAQWIIAHGIKTVWGLVSPAVVVSTEAATAQIEKEISDLGLQKQAATQREDFDAAKSYKEQMEAKQLDKAAAIATAYTSISPEEQKKKLSEIFTPFGNTLKGGGVSLKLDKAPEHYETSNYFNLLNNFSKTWPPLIPHGTYGVVWAGALTETQPFLKKLHDQAQGFEKPAFVSEVGLKEPVQEFSAPIAPVLREMVSRISKPAAPPVDANKIYTGEELEKMHANPLRFLATKLNVWVNGQPKQETIKRVLEKQTAAAILG